MALDEIPEATEAELLVEPPLLCVVVGNPQLDLVYQHQVEAETGRFGTREIREALRDGVPLSGTDVLASVHETLTEGLAIIGRESAPGG